MASKYDFFWRSKLKDISVLLDKAYHGHKGHSLDVSGIKSLGVRGNWYGVVDVYKDAIGKGEMVHAKSLGNVIIENELLKKYRDSHFRLTISSDCVLTVKKTPLVGRDAQRKQAVVNSKPIRVMGAKVVCFIPCCKSKEATGKIINPSQALSEGLLPKTWENLLSGRKNMDYCIDKNSNITTALNLYTGKFYKELAKDTIIEKALKGEFELIIISAGYGIINALEPIHKYDAVMSGKVARQWRDTGLAESIADYLLNQKPNRVYGFFAGEEYWSNPSSKYRHFFTEGVRKAKEKGLGAGAGCFFREEGLGSGTILSALGKVFNEFVSLGFDPAYVKKLENETKVIGNISVGLRKI